MNQADTCSHCGAKLAPGSKFCETCGKSVSTPLANVVAPPNAPPVTAPRSSKRGMLIGLAIASVLGVCVCIAVAVFGYFYLQKPTTTVAINTPQVAALPTLSASSSASSVAAPTIRPATVAPLATLPPQPTPLPTLPSGVLFDDDFSSKPASESKGWTFTSNASSERTWSPNQMIVSLKSAGASDLIMPNGEYDDFGAEVQVQTSSGSTSVIALTFRYSANGTNRSSYSFGITAQGEYYLAKTVNGIAARPSPIELTPSSLINRGTSPNILGVIVTGKRINLYINRTQVMSLDDDSIQGKGKIGIGVSADQGAAVMAISRFTVYTPERAFAAWCPTAASFPAGILFEETFASQRIAACNDWGTLKSENADFVWNPNSYTVSVKKPNNGQVWYMHITERQYTDFALEVEAQPLDDNVGVYGLAFRYSTNRDNTYNYYRLGLVPDGRYSLMQLLAGEWQQPRLVDYTSSSLIKTGKNKNLLGVIVQGNNISLYINRTLVKAVTDNSYQGGGYVGVTVASGTNTPTTVNFSRVTVLTPDQAKADWGGAPIVTTPPTAAPKPTASIAPGLYVTSLRTDPAPAKRGQDIGFYATFLNTTNSAQTPRWLVYVYRADNTRNSFGETALSTVNLPIGSSEFKALGSWKLGGGGGCEDFITRVATKDSNNQVVFFIKTDGAMFEYRFSVCP